MRRTYFNGQGRATLGDNPIHRRETQDYPSADPNPVTAVHAQARRDNPQYSGTYVRGIATMHKSNAVPVSEGVNTNPKLHQGGVE